MICSTKRISVIFNFTRECVDRCDYDDIIYIDDFIDVAWPPITLFQCVTSTVHGYQVHFSSAVVQR